MKSFVFSFCSLFFLFLSHSAFAQFTYVRNYGTNLADDKGSEVILTSDNHYLVVGTTKILNQSNADIFIAKFTHDGAAVFSKIFETSYYDEARGVVELVDGSGYIIIGKTNEFDDQGDWVIFRIDFSGNVIWKKFFGNVGLDAPVRILTLSDGNYVIVGQGYGQLIGVPKEMDGCFIKINSNGDFLNVYIIPENKREFITNACLAADGGIVACGFVKHQTQNKYEVFVFKLKPDFNQEFINTYSFTRETKANAITQLENGEFIIAGSYDVEGNGLYLDPLILRIDPASNLLRSRQITQLRNDSFLDIKQRKDGKLVASGNSTKYMVSPATSSAGVWILDTSGVYRSRNVFGSRTNHSYATNLKIHNDSLLILTGYANLKNDYSATTTYTFFNTFLAKTDTGGFHREYYFSKNGLDFGSVPVGNNAGDTLIIVNNGFDHLNYSLLWNSGKPPVFDLPNVITSLDTLYSSDTLKIIGIYTPSSISNDSSAFNFHYAKLGWSSNIFKQLYLKGTGTSSTDISDRSDIPATFAIFQNHPNPFNPGTRIKYQLPVKSRVLIKIYDALGKEITTLVDMEKEAGEYEEIFEANKLSSGVYLCRIITGAFIKTIKMMFIK
ncbi:MAG: T9SS type A sorting domain-containing protein [Ignavibacteriales bacterium]|nr:T9SS type A sorting domain-containing protein [Ignavibacteriales bacterium]HOJ19099.1 T9SS type A sorting domain-containing protein [Ignavibacteriaceae bacterium]